MPDLRLGKAREPGFEHVDTTVQAAVPYYGAYDLTDPDNSRLTQLIGFVARQFTRPVGE